MVAHAPLTLRVEAMRLEDVPAVQAIERASFATPWPAHAYRTELGTNRLARYFVARIGTRIVAFAGMWLMVDEAHITTFAVAPAWRRQRIAERLLLALLDHAREHGGRDATLEVRISNVPARRLYEKYGFRPVGVRPRYYSDDSEDALIMTTEPFDSEALTGRLERLRVALDAAPPLVAPPTSEASGGDGGDIERRPDR